MGEVNGTLILNGGVIDGNDAISDKGAYGLGGGVYVAENATFIMNNGVISNNNATDGGAIYLANNANLELLGGTVGKNAQPNNALRGGGLFISSEAGRVVLAGSIENNTAENGGGIYNEKDIIIESMSLSNNTASSNGGGIYTTKPLTIRSGLVDGNTARNNGGGIYAESAELYIPSVIVSNNSAKNGGGIYANKTNVTMEAAALDASKAKIDSNKAQKGAGIYVVGTSATPAEFKIVNYTLTGNTYSGSGSRGGAIYVTYTNAQILGKTQITGNGSSTVPVEYGAGIYVDTGALVEFMANEDAEGVPIEANIANNFATNGGGVYIAAGTFRMYANTYIQNNTAQNGAGVYVAGTGVFELVDGTISNNTANNNGAGIYYASSGASVLSGGTISGNKADKGKGGAVYIASNILTLDGTSITGGNKAQNGAGVYIMSESNVVSKLVVSSGKIASNTATAGGNGVYVDGSYATLELAGLINIDNVYMKDNAKPISVLGGAQLNTIPTLLVDFELLTVGKIVATFVDIADEALITPVNDSYYVEAVARNLVLRKYATFVTINPNGGTLIYDGTTHTSSFTVDIGNGKPMRFLANIENGRDGYILNPNFMGSDGKTYNSASTMVRYELILDAQWESIVFTVKYVLDGEELEAQTVSKSYEGGISLYDPTIAYHTFDGWTFSWKVGNVLTTNNNQYVKGSYFRLLKNQGPDTMTTDDYNAVIANGAVIYLVGENKPNEVKLKLHNNLPKAEVKEVTLYQKDLELELFDYNEAFFNDGHILLGWAETDTGVTKYAYNDVIDITSMDSIELFAKWVAADAYVCDADGSNAVYYQNLSEAFEAVQNGQTLVLLRNKTITSTITIINKDIKITSRASYALTRDIVFLKGNMIVVGENATVEFVGNGTNTFTLHGGATYNGAGNPTSVATSSIIATTGSGKAILGESLIITNNNATTDSATITGYVEIVGGSYTNNYGALVKVTGGSKIIGGKFENNTTEDGAGAIIDMTGANQDTIVSNIIFLNNKGNNGVVINANQIIDGCEFTNNKLETVILVANLGSSYNATISQTAINVNTGNGITLNGNATLDTVRIFSCANIAVYNDGQIVNIARSEISNNISTSDSAVVVKDGKLIVDDSEFDGNKGNKGGAISATHSIVGIYSSAFTNNTATSDGGAIYVYSGEGTTTDVIGGVALNSTTVWVTLNDVTLANNTSGAAGGAIFVNSSSTGFPLIVEANGLTLTGNTANNGNSIYIKSEDNTKPTTFALTNADIEKDNDALGGIYVAGLSNLTLYGTTNIETPIYIANQNNFINVSAKMTVTDPIFINEDSWALDRIVVKYVASVTPVANHFAIDSTKFAIGRNGQNLVIEKAKYKLTLKAGLGEDEREATVNELSSVVYNVDFGETLAGYLSAPTTVAFCEGHEFVAWVVEDGLAAAPTTMPDGHLTLIATWTPIEYTLTLHMNDASEGKGSTRAKLNGSTASNVQEILHIGYESEKLALYTAGTFGRVGYTFKGWATAPDSEVTVAIGGDGFVMAAADAELYAIWEVMTYDVFYYLNGGDNGNHTTGVANDTYYEEVSFDQTIEVFYTTAKVGYILDGWSLTDNGTLIFINGVNTAFTMNESALTTYGADDGNVELYTRWTAEQYTLKYNLSGGSFMGNTGVYTAPTKVAFDTAYTLITSGVTYSGYTFKGWALTEGTKTVRYDASKPQMLINDAASKEALVNSGIITLYAVWEADEYKVVFNKNNPYATGSMSNISVSLWDGATQNPYGSVGITNRVTLPANAFSYVGHRFLGWSLDPVSNVTYSNGASFELTSTLVSSANAQNEVILYAIWEAYTINVYENFNGSTIVSASIEVAIDGSFTIKGADLPVKNGYIIGRISSSANKNSTGATTYALDTKTEFTATSDIDVYIIWKSVTYTIVYDLSGAQGTTPASVKVSLYDGSATWCYNDDGAVSSWTLPTNTLFQYPGLAYAGWSYTTDSSVEYSKNNLNAVLTQKVVNEFATGTTITMYARWASETNVTFDMNTNGFTFVGTRPPTITVDIGADVTLASEPASKWTLKDGSNTVYAYFVGWHTDSYIESENWGYELVSPKYEGGQTTNELIGDATVYAIWRYYSNPEWFTYSVSSGKATITGLSNAGKTAVAGGKTSIYFPISAKISGTAYSASGTEYAITAVGENFASTAEGVREIYIPSVIDTIGYGAFAINSIERFMTDDKATTYLADDATGILYYVTSGVDLFAYPANCGVTNFVATSTVTIDGTTYAVNAISKKAFYNNSKLTGLDFTKCSNTSPTAIGESAFENCTALSILAISSNKSITTIGDKAFKGCVGLTEVDLTNSPVTVIGNNAFENCTELETVTFGFKQSGTNSIGNKAFSGCSKLSTITFAGGSLKTIGERAFENTALTTVDLSPVKSSLTKIGFAAFAGCNSITSMTIPFVGESTSSNNYLTRLFGKATTYTSAGNDAPATLKTVSICSDGFFAVPEGAFYGCNNITTVNGKFSSVGDYAFYGCTSLNKVVDSADYASATVENKTVSLENATSIGNNAFTDCKTIENVVAPKVKTIGNYAFSGCTNLKTFNATENRNGVVIDSKITTLGDYAFTNCTSISLVEITAPISIGANTFANCSFKTAYVTTLSAFNAVIVSSGLTQSAEVGAGNHNDNGTIYVYADLYQKLSDDQKKYHIIVLDAVLNYTELNASRGEGYYGSITEAVANARNNDVLIVKVDQYLTQTVTIDKTIRILAGNSSSVAEGYDVAIYRVNTLTGAMFNITAGTTSLGATAGSNYTDITIRELTIDGGAVGIPTPTSTATGSIITLAAGYVLTIDNNVVITNNYTTGNGALINANGTVNLNGGVLSFGYTTGNGGAIYSTTTVNANGTEIQNCRAVNGGAIYGTGEILVSNSTIANNTATGNGGAIYGTSTITISGGQLSANSATVNGGAVYATTDGGVVITNGVISGNSAAIGGAVYADSFTMSSGTITQNTATNNGGGIAGNTLITISGGSISENTATNDGGAVYANRVNITGGTISSNTAKNGGAISVAYGTITNTQITANTASVAGGAIYANGVSGNKLTLGTGAVISSNICSGSAAGKGGAGVYITGAGEVAITGATISSNNNASGYGGGVFVATGKVTMSSGSIISNTAVNGGGVFVYNGEFNFSGGNVGASGNGNKATHASSQAFGGGIYIANNTNTKLVITATAVVSYNEAKTNGGGIYIASNITQAQTEISGGTISNNEVKGSAGCGGGIYIAASTTVNITGGTIKDNLATTSGFGGGIYVVGTLTLGSGAKLQYNEATTGGAIYISATGTVTTSAEIIGNKAKTNGGGVYIASTTTNSGTLNFAGGTISSNTVDTNGKGGAIFVTTNAYLKVSNGIACDGSIYLETVVTTDSTPVGAAMKGVVNVNTKLEGVTLALAGTVVEDGIVAKYLGSYNADFSRFSFVGSAPYSAGKYVKIKQPVIINLTRDTIHGTVQDAVTAASSGDVLCVNKDITLESRVTIAKNLYFITAKNYFISTTDTAGVFKVESGYTVSFGWDDSNATIAAAKVEYGAVTLTIKGSGDANLVTAGTIVLHTGVVVTATSDTTAVKATDSGCVEIYGATINGSKHGVELTGSSTIAGSIGTITTCKVAIKYNSSATSNVTKLNITKNNSSVASGNAVISVLKGSLELIECNIKENVTNNNSVDSPTVVSVSAGGTIKLNNCAIASNTNGSNTAAQTSLIGGAGNVILSNTTNISGIGTAVFMTGAGSLTVATATISSMINGIVISANSAAHNIENLTLSSLSGKGIELNLATGSVLIKSSSISGCGTGIYTYGSSVVDIQSVTITTSVVAIEANSGVNISGSNFNNNTNASGSIVILKAASTVASTSIKSNSGTSILEVSSEVNMKDGTNVEISGNTGTPVAIKNGGKLVIGNNVKIATSATGTAVSLGAYGDMLVIAGSPAITGFVLYPTADDNMADNIEYIQVRGDYNVATGGKIKVKFVGSVTVDPDDVIAGYYNADGSATSTTYVNVDDFEADGYALRREGTKIVICEKVVYNHHLKKYYANINTAMSEALAQKSNSEQKLEVLMKNPVTVDALKYVGNSITDVSNIWITSTLDVTITFANRITINNNAAQLKLGQLTSASQSIISGATISGSPMKFVNGGITLTTGSVLLSGNTTFDLTGSNTFVINGGTFAVSGKANIESSTIAKTTTLVSVGTGTTTAVFNMDGGTVKHPITIGSKGTFTLEGGIVSATITLNTSGAFVLKGTGKVSGVSGTGVKVNGNFSMSAGEISSNTAMGVEVYTGGTFTMTGGTVTKNSATNGAGVYVRAGGNFSFSGGTISENAATGNGGGVYIANNAGTVAVTGGTITKNTASYGGGIYNDKTNQTIGATSITSNTATTLGGGIYTNKSATIDGTSVSSNTAPAGGGVGAVASASLTIKSTSTVTTIDSNVASTTNGGGVNAGNVYVYQSKITSNNASKGSGGGIYASSVTLYSTIEIKENKAKTYGGGICATEITQNANASALVISNNTSQNFGGGVYATNISLAESTINANSAVNAGGGIYGENISLTKTTVSSNFNTKDGAGIYVVKTLSLSDVNIYSNQASQNGGGIYVPAGASITSASGNIYWNTANANGGGIYNLGSISIGSSLVFNKTAGNENSAVGKGRDIYHNNPVVTSLKIASYLKMKYVEVWLENPTKDKNTGSRIYVDGNYTSTYPTYIKFDTEEYGPYTILVQYSDAAHTTTDDWKCDMGLATWDPSDGSQYYIIVDLLPLYRSNKAPLSGGVLPTDGKYYDSLQKAINESAKGDYIYVIKDFTSLESASADGSKEFTLLTLEGKTLGTNSTNTLLTVAGAKVNFGLSSSQYGVPIVTSSSADTIKVTSGTVNVYNTTTFEGNYTATASNSVFAVSGGTVNIKSGVTLTNTTSTKSGKGTGITSTGGTVNFAGTISSFNNSGIYVNGGTVNMTGGSVSTNIATNGAGALVNSGTFNLSGGSITNNTASNNGGAVAVTGGTFAMSNGSLTKNAAVNGGGLYMSSGTFKFDGGTIGASTSTTPGSSSAAKTAGGNTASTSGGGIYISGGTVANSSSSTAKTVSANYATSNGGGVYTKTSLSTGSANDAWTITRNNASNGGGLYIDGSATISYKTISNNGGNGVYVNNAATIQTSVAISGNGSAGVYAVKDVTLGSGVTISSNTRGVYVAGGTTTINGATISSNAAGTSNGGGVYVPSGSTLSFASGSITGNGAKNGAGVYNAGTFTMSSGTITNNTSTENGGGVYNSGTFTFNGGSIGNKTTVPTSAANAVAGGGNAAASGGAIYNSGTISASSSTTGKNIKGNYATSYGGGVYTTKVLPNGSNDNWTISYNYSGTFGGGIYTSVASTMNYKNVTYNKSSYGGGIYLDATSSSTTLNSSMTVSHNTATSNGGGVYVSSANHGLSVSAANISSNTASSGGGIYTSGTLTINDNSTINSNTASSAGGGLYLSGGTTTISGSSTTISSNTASSSGATGAGIRVAGATVTMANATIGSNAGYNGAGVYISSGSFTLNSGSVTKNAASNYGGGIYISGGTFAHNGGYVGGSQSSYYSSASTAKTNGGNTAVNGGGIYFTGGTITNSGSTSKYVRNNHATRGGGIYINSANSIGSSTLSAVKYNYATNGGGLYVNTAITIASGISIANNGAGTGGGIYANAGLTLNGSVSSNTATGNGGGIYMNSGALSMGSGAAINSNTAAHGGGLYYNSSSSSSLSAGNIYSNSVSSYGEGGGVRQAAGTLTFSGTAVYSNSATYGGGLFLRGTASISSSVIRNNTANYGGGVYVREKTTTLSGGTIRSNTANGNGGGVYIDGGTFVFASGRIGAPSTTSSHPSSGSNAISNEGNYAKDYGGGIAYVSGTFNASSGNKYVRGNYADDGGGALSIHSSWSTSDTYRQAVLTASVYNVAGAGGGVYVASGYTFTMSGGTISNNKSVGSSSYGGGVHVAGTFAMSGGTISSNSSAYGGGGVGTHNGAFTLNITGGTISSNTANWGGGIGYYTTTSSSVTLSGVSITSNRAYNYGGGLYLAGSGSSATLSNMTISSNTADEYGGGIAVTYSSTTTVNSTVNIHSNTASSGGGVYVGGGTIYLKNKIYKNTANYAGGGLYIYSGTADVAGAWFCNSTSTTTVPTTGSAAKTAGGNYAATKGGAIYASGGTLKVGSSSDVYVRNNYAPSGGGIYFDTSWSTGSYYNSDLIYELYYNGATYGGGIYANATLTLSSGYVWYNTAKYGGGVYVSSGIFTLSGAYIDHNKASGSGSLGAGVYVGGGTFKMTDGSINSNENVGASGTRGSGGGLYYASSGTASTYSGGDIWYNIANYGAGMYIASGKITMSGGDIYRNTASYGAGVYAYNGRLDMSSGLIDYNDAYSNGGGVYLASGGKFYMSGGQVYSNKASSNGGGIYVSSYSSTTLSLTSGTIGATSGTSVATSSSYSNYSGGSGGGVYIAGSSASVTINNVTFRRNYAAGNGGGVCTLKGFTATGVTLCYNGAGGDGGGWAHQSSGTNQLNNCKVYNNKAYDGGGVYNKSGGTIEIWNTDCHVYNNTATNNGGGIYSSGTIKLGNYPDVYGNTASYNGGGLYSSGVVYFYSGVIGTTSGSVGDTATSSSRSNYASNNGGGIYCSSYFADFGGEVNRNYASNNGGGVYFGGSGSTTIKGHIKRNRAGNNGGGAYVYWPTTFNNNIFFNRAYNGAGIYAADKVTLNRSCDIYDNTASNHGGGIYNAGYTLTANAGSWIECNTASGNGGGVYQSSGTFDLWGESGTSHGIRNNEAWWGGGVCISGGAMYIMNYCTIYYNDAEYGGGIFVNGGTVTSYSGYIKSNTANKYGGGIHMYGGTFNIQGGYIQSNTSGKSSGTHKHGWSLKWCSNYYWGKDIAIEKGTVNMSGGTVGNSGDGCAVVINYFISGSNGTWNKTGGTLNGSSWTDKNG